MLAKVCFQSCFLLIRDATSPNIQPAPNADDNEKNQGSRHSLGLKIVNLVVDYKLHQESF